jgi:formylglycine-generating enzyme required for sulfatase activity
LLKGLRRQVQDMPGDVGLIEALAALRRGWYLESDQKVLLVLDQFEQWLHAKRNEENTELVQALRHCDGGRLQCVVMVRDDFWLAVSRFMTALEIELVQGKNMALVDLFYPRHAKKVLAAFGRAFGTLPERAGELPRDEEFLDQAVAGLAQDGKVIPVRLALFAEMVKGKPWTPATLKDVGGMEGVGVTFLEETFTASTAPPQHRLHQKAAQAVLKALLPEIGTDMKGNMRSQQELLEASGYATQPRNFDALLRVLDGELRLITPTDPEGVDSENAPSAKVAAGEKYYQLTHDYLVPSLRDWLTRKQTETRRGRAELLLADRAAGWNARRENRQLPSLFQWLNIRWWTQKKNWTPPQNKMMQKAQRYHAVRGSALGLLLAVVTVTGVVIRNQIVERQRATQAAGLVQAVLNADTAQVPAIIGEMADYRRLVDPLLREEYDKTKTNSRQKLHTSLALLPVDPAQVDYLYDRLLDAEPSEVPVIRDALAPHKDELLDKLWAVAEAPGKQRLRAAAALAKYDPDSEKWAKVQDAVGNDLVNEPSVYVPVWMASLRPVRVQLLPSLSVVFGDTNRPVERSLATEILADYAVDQPKVLADLVMDADVKQFAIFLPKLKECGEQGLPALRGEIDRKLPAGAKPAAQEKLAKRQANAAVALLKMDRAEKAWTVLKHSPNPRARSYLIHRLYPFGAQAVAIIKRLDEEADVTIRRTLLLSLGEYGEKEITLEDRKRLLPKLQEIYGNDADPGLHAAAEWLLRTWKEEAWLKQVNEEWAKDKDQREKRLNGIQQLVTKEKEKAPPQWYVNSQGQTMVVIPGPVKFAMGSPPTEADRRANEFQHTKRIGRTFALAAKSVTLDQYRKFDALYGIFEIEPHARTGTSPVLGTDWYQAVAYCNWLSKEEGMPESEWCYEPVRDPSPEYKEGMKLARNYLQRQGYRLPTEAEMEYATRAGAETTRYYGETDELLEKYAWYLKNGQERSWPVGSKKPNDMGMFDMQGNVYTWCQERYMSYPRLKSGESSEDKEDALVVRSTDGRVLRGGSFAGQASLVRSAFRNDFAPTNRRIDIGFRPARTFTP